MPSATKNGETFGTGKSPVHVYGRFIPVPVLAELMRGIQEGKGKSFEMDLCNGKESVRNKAGQETTDKNNAGSVKSQCKEYFLEKRLFECTNLLCKAVGKLEKIDNIVCVAYEESDNAKNEEIEEGFAPSKSVCSCTTHGKPSETAFSSKSSLKRCRDSPKEAELLRKISGLREKLKKIEECHKDVKRQIKSSQQRAGKCSSTLQVTELYSRQEQERTKKLEMALERLIKERGKVLSEMCQALICRHSLKKASRSSLSFRGGKNSRYRIPEMKKEDCGEHDNCTCGSPCMDPSDSDRVNFSQSISSERSSSKDLDNTRQDDDSCPSRCSKTHLRNYGEIYKNMNPEKLSSLCCYENDVDEIMKPTVSISCRKSVLNNANRSKCVGTSDPCNEKNGRKTDNVKKKQKLKFACAEKECGNKSYLDNLAYYEKIKSKTQPVTLYQASVNFRNHSTELVPTKETNQERNMTENVLTGRKIKSETTMKEIEKTLRNYEQRLKAFDCLEYKVENLKQKLSEANQLKKKLMKRKNEGKKLLVAEQEKTNKEMTKICWENWELKRQVQHLTAKFELQSKKIEALKCHKHKLRILEGEAEELKKELAEYQENCEDQRKCINKLENVVVSQKAEMEKLMNHIRKLTTTKEIVPPCEPYQEKRCAQRSRSYSPEVRMRQSTTSRPRTQAGNQKVSSEEEEAYLSYCCRCEEMYPQSVDDESGRCYSSPNWRPGRFMN